VPRDPRRRPTDGARLFRCFKPFQTGRNRQATDSTGENARCFAVSAFFGNAACEILMATGQPIKTHEGLSPRIVKQRNRQRFMPNYQCIVCFTTA
jgi:hypothetical protein